MEKIRETGKRLGFHEENGEIIDHYTERFKAEGRNEPIDHSHSRPVIAEREAVERMITFAEETGAKIHMFHVSSGSAAEAVARGNDRGVDVTAETTPPHYLWFTEEVMREKGNVARVQPPIRDAEERDRLWEVGIDDGVIDCIATDHAPHTPAEKKVDDPSATPGTRSGFVGLETGCRPCSPSSIRVDSRSRWVRRHSTNPAQVWGCTPEGVAAGGYRRRPHDRRSESRVDGGRRRLPLEELRDAVRGRVFPGKAVATVVRGEVVYEDGDVIGESGYGTRVDVD